MSIITISRGSYSRGKEVAEKLAARLGYTCISRDILLEASEEFNTPEIKLVRALHDAPRILDRFSNGKERYLSYITAQLLKHARRDNMVYHGLAGHFLLRDIPHVLKVRIIADMKDRVREEMRRENIPAEKARAILEKDDRERRKWGLQVYGTDTWDSSLYDIVLHIGKLTVDDAVGILADMAGRAELQATPASRKLVEDMALAAMVRASLAEAAPNLQVTADGGRVLIEHIDRTAARQAHKRIREIVLGIEGAEEVIVNPVEPRKQEDHINPFHNIG